LEGFSSRRKALSYAGEFTITQHVDKGRELELWYRHVIADSAFEFVAWISPDNSVLIEARKLNRKKFGRLLFQSSLDLASMFRNAASLSELRRRANQLVQVFEKSVRCIRLNEEDPELPTKLTAMWTFGDWA